jgi:hypothetical protein
MQQKLVTLDKNSCIRQVEKTHFSSSKCCHLDNAQGPMTWKGCRLNKAQGLGTKKGHHLDKAQDQAIKRGPHLDKVQGPTIEKGHHLDRVQGGHHLDKGLQLEINCNMHNLDW